MVQTGHLERAPRLSPRGPQGRAAHESSASVSSHEVSVTLVQARQSPYLRPSTASVVGSAISQPASSLPFGTPDERRQH
jgi:hypothetical protein